MHYLVVSPVPIFPTISGSRSLILGMIRQIRRAGHRVSFLYSIQDGDAEESARATIAEVDAYDACFYPSRLREGAWNQVLINAALNRNGLNYDLDAWYDPAIDDKVKEIYARDPFDVLLSNYIWMSKIFDAVPADVVKIQQTHDSMTERAHFLATQGLPPSFFSVTAVDEGRALDRADINIALQHGEEQFFRELTKKPVCVVQHVPEEIPFTPVIIPTGRKLRVGFIGSNNGINVRTLVNLVEALSAAPALCDLIDLRVIGEVGAIFVQKPPFVTVVGRCPDLAAAYAETDIMINPMLDGTGLKIKSVEALQHHKPILMTKAASEGLMSPYHFHRCDTIKDVLGYIKLFAGNPQNLALIQAAGEKVLRAYRERLAIASRVLTAPRDVLREMETHSDNAPQRQPADADIAIMKRLVPEGATWIDIGSRHGETAFAIAPACRPAKIILFECGLGNIERIKSNVASNKTETIFDLRMLGFAVSRSAGYGRLEHADDRCQFIYDENNDAALTPCLPLDREFAREQRIDAIHIGVEKCDDILAGLNGLVKKFKPVLFVSAPASAQTTIDRWTKANAYAAERHENLFVLRPLFA